MMIFFFLTQNNCVISDWHTHTKKKKDRVKLDSRWFSLCGLDAAECFTLMDMMRKQQDRTCSVLFRCRNICEKGGCDIYYLKKKKEHCVNSIHLHLQVMHLEQVGFFRMFKNNYLCIRLYKCAIGVIWSTAEDVPVNAPLRSPRVLYYPVGRAVLLSITHSKHGMIHRFRSVVTLIAAKYQH